MTDLTTMPAGELLDSVCYTESSHDDEIKAELLRRLESAERLREAAEEACEAIDRCSLYGPADAARDRIEKLRAALQSP